MFQVKRNKQIKRALCMQCLFSIATTVSETTLSTPKFVHIVCVSPTGGVLL